MAPILGYWNIRGLAEPIRLLLHYTETEFTDERYETEENPDQDWFSIKFTLGLDFPNLPYFIDGDIKITQSNAILRHIARQHNLYGSTAEEQLRVDIAENQLMDLRNKFVELCYNPNFEKLKPDYIKEINNTFKQFSEFLGSRKYLAGDKISFVDFVFFELSDQHRIFEASLFEAYPNIKEFLTRFEELPAIAAYRKSDKFKAHPINTTYASFY